MWRPLILFDLNGVLATKMKNRKKCYNTNDIIITIHNSYHWCVDPYVPEALKKLSHKYDLGVWTSTPREYATPVVDYLFRNINLTCFWCREECDPDPRKQNHFSTIKNIHKAQLWLEREAILIIDDTESKVNLNPHWSYFCIDKEDQINLILDCLIEA